MPFVEQSDVLNFIPASLRATATAKFAEYEQNAAIEVRDTTGVAIPASVADAPDWVAVPIAAIIANYAIRDYTKANPELLQQVRGDYDRAIEQLRTRVFKQRPARVAGGIIAGVQL